MERLRVITKPNSEWGPNDKLDKKSLQSPYKMTEMFGVDNPGHM